MNYVRKRICIIIYTLSLLNIVLIQGVIADDEKEWGEVSPEYLQMTVYPADTSAGAIKIFDIESVDLTAQGRLEVVIERHFQIKILKDEAKEEYANYGIGYWHSNIMTDIDAQNILPDGTKLELDDDNIFDEQEKDRYKYKKFAFPDVRIGSILEIKYKLISNSVYTLAPWYFHEEIPVIESEINLQLSPFFSYFVKVNNDPDSLVKFTKDNYYNKYRQKWEDRFRYRATNLPAIKDEPYISTLRNYKANINFQIQSVTYPGYHKEFIKDLQTLSNTLLEEEYDDFEEPESEVEDLVSTLITPDMNNDKKARILFEYARDHFDHAQNTNIYVERDQDDILEQKKASDTERNLLLKVMLQAAGFEVMPVIISTRDHGVVHPEIPFLSQYNKTILLVNVDNNYYMFDARDPWITYGQLPPSSLVKNAMLIKEDNSSFLEIPNSGIRSMKIIESKIDVSDDGNLNGSSEILAIGYGSRDYNSALYNDKNMGKMITKELVNNIDGYTVTEADSNLTAIPADTFDTKFSFKLENYAETVDNEIYLKPGIYFVKNKNVFVSEKRVFPIEFGYMAKTIETSYFTLPEDLTVTELPKEVVVENKYFRYQRTIVLTKKDPVTIGFSRQFEIKSLVAPESEYSKIKNDYSKIVDADQEVIVLKKLK